MANLAWRQPEASSRRWAAALVRLAPSLAVSCIAFVAADFWPVLGRLRFLGVFLFSRLDRGALLEHATRRRIVDSVAARPGQTLQALRDNLGVAWGTMVHHVRILERHGQIVSVRQGPRRLLYVASTPEGRARGDLALLRTPMAHGIARSVQASPGIRQVEVARLLGVRAPAASKHLSRLASAGLVVVERSGGTCRYTPTPRLQTALGLRESGDHHGPGALRPPRPARAREHARTHGPSDPFEAPAMDGVAAVAQVPSARSVPF